MIRGSIISHATSEIKKKQPIQEYLDSSAQPQDDTSSNSQVAGSLQKINNKKISQQETHITALKKLLGYYQDITETIREPFIILDKDFRVVTANEAFYHQFKVLKKDTENRSFYELGNNQWDTPDLRELLENILPKHQVLNNYEITHDFPGIGHKTMHLNARQVDAKQLILLAIVDVTRQKQLQDDTIEMTASLIKQRNKLQGLNDAKDEFINMASHQLRTPATAVKQYIGMLAEGYWGKLSEVQNKMLNTAYESNERELEIIEDMLRVAKVDEGKVYLIKSSCDMARQLEEAVKDQLASFNNRGQSIVFNKPLEPVIASIDKKLMRMVIENLLDNASKYSYEDKQITIDLKQDDKLAVIAIKDQGVGIHKKDHVKLFQRFSRIDNPLSISAEGTGLGLYWVKKILDLHEGSMEVISRVDYGSTFTVKLPVLN
ncbi:PAS domain-containing sensor histidine kinase [Candidatus Parcubacteria bacterium]|nr:PAS domain-containing sensor histidine kinase [Candidatus Parcubacteria bacterium]